MKITALVVDDEPLARRRLAALIADVPWAVQVGEAHDGPSTIEAVRRLRPDVVFLDIQMPELSGIEVVARLREHEVIPAVVFTTAFSHYAVTAFELEAVDYLLKPFGVRRFLAAFERARHTAITHASGATLDRARSVLAASDPPARLERIFVREASSILPLALPVIERVEAQDDYAMIHAEAVGTSWACVSRRSRLACRTRPSCVSTARTSSISTTSRGWGCSTTDRSRCT